jgi:hypothetical protein
MTITLDGTNGITFPAGGTGNPAGTVVGTSDTQSLTNKTIGSGYAGTTITASTAVASTSGTAILFTGIPSWVKRITIMFQGASTTGTSIIQVQIGSGSVLTSGYSGFYGYVATSTAAGGPTSTGFAFQSTNANNNISGVVRISNLNGNAWVAEVNAGSPGANATNIGGGSVSLSGALDRVNITTVNGTDTFDAGTINIMWE